jgi:hypothetical protein
MKSELNTLADAASLRANLRAVAALLGMKPR